MSVLFPCVGVSFVGRFVMFAVYVAVAVLTLNAVAVAAYMVRFLVQAAAGVVGSDELAARRAQRSRLVAP